MMGKAPGATSSQQFVVQEAQVIHPWAVVFSKILKCHVLSSHSQTALWWCFFTMRELLNKWPGELRSWGQLKTYKGFSIDTSSHLKDIQTCRLETCDKRCPTTYCTKCSLKLFIENKENSKHMNATGLAREPQKFRRSMHLWIQSSNINAIY